MNGVRCQWAALRRRAVLAAAFAPTQPLKAFGLATSRWRAHPKGLQSSRRESTAMGSRSGRLPF